MAIKFKYSSFKQNGKTEFSLAQPAFLNEQTTDGSAAGSTIISPMPGVFDKILVKVGDQIEANQPVAVIIAMKMEYVLKAQRKGVVKTVTGQLGKNVAKGDVVVSLHDENSENES